VKVAKFRRSGAIGFLTLEGVEDRNAAEAIDGFTISVDRHDLPELGDDEVYLADLVGLAVEHGGERLGVVERIEVYPSSSALVVSTADRELEIPIHPPYVEEVDLRARTVRVARLDELLADTDTAQSRREG